MSRPLLETESSKLPQRVEEARAAIQARIDELNQDHQGTPEERKAIQFALNCLKVLTTELGWSKPQP